MGDELFEISMEDFEKLKGSRNARRMSKEEFFARQTGVAKEIVTTLRKMAGL